MKVHLKNVRIAFPKLFEPDTVAGSQNFRRGALFIIEGSDEEQLKAVRSAIAAAAAERWPDPKKRAAIMGVLERKDYLCLHDGADKAAKYEGFEGNYYVSANTKGGKTPDAAGAVTVIDQFRNPLTSASGRPYAGCYVNAIIDVYAQDNSFGQRVNAALKGVQFWRDGDAFGGGAPAMPDEFESDAEPENWDDIA
jgi:hypothetical protein